MQQAINSQLFGPLSHPNISSQSYSFPCPAKQWRLKVVEAICKISKICPPCCVSLCILSFCWLTLSLEMNAKSCADLFSWNMNGLPAMVQRNVEMVTRTGNSLYPNCAQTYPSTSISFLIQNICLKREKVWTLGINIDREIWRMLASVYIDIYLDIDQIFGHWFR